VEKFKETLHKRLYALATYTGGLIVLMSFGLVRPLAGNSEAVRAFMAGVNAGLLAVALAVVVLSGVKYIRALKNADKLKTLYIYEKDERRLYIRSGEGGTAIQLILMGLTTAMIVAEFFDQTVFFTLLGAVVFAAGVKAVLKIVYTNEVS
jgi:hypothetical protein